MCIEHYPRTVLTCKLQHTHTHTVTHTRLTALFSGTTRVGRYQKVKINLGFTEARDSEWQWHQLGHMQVCTLLQTDIHVSTPPLSFLQARCPSCCPTNSVKALKAKSLKTVYSYKHFKAIFLCHLLICFDTTFCSVTIVFTMFTASVFWTTVATVSASVAKSLSTSDLCCTVWEIP